MDNAKMQTRNKINWGNYTVIYLTLALGIILTIASDTFLSKNNLLSMAYAVAVKFFAVIGFTYLMIMGEIDLSVGSMMAVGGMFAGLLTTVNVNAYLACLAALIICIALGLLNGFLTVQFKVPSMMITLGSMYALRGVANMLVVELTGKAYSEPFQAISKIQIGGVFIWIYVMIIVAVVLEILLHNTSLFRKMYYVGENLDTARIYGIKSGKIKIGTFALSAATACIAGLLVSSRIQYAESATGEGEEFQMLTAAVLGGASLNGGKGSIFRSVIGLFFLQMITTAMTIFNIDPLVQQLIVGVILIVAVWVDTRLNARSKT